MITKEQIETFFDDGIFDERSRGGPEWRAIAMDIKAVALQALAMQPRPLSEIEGPRKTNPVNLEYEEKAKNLLKAELKRRGVTYGQLVEKLAAIGVTETGRNLNNKSSRGGFTSAFMLQCLDAIGARDIRL